MIREPMARLKRPTDANRKISRRQWPRVVGPPIRLVTHVHKTCFYTPVKSK